jgi:hypothetical protein
MAGLDILHKLITKYYTLTLINSYSLINKPHDEKTRTLKKTNVHI